VFENLKYKQLKTLIEVVNDTKEKKTEHIIRRYKYESQNYDGAKEFLQELKLLRESKGCLSITKDLQGKGNTLLSDEKIKRLLLDELLTTKSSISKEVKRYLENFKVKENSFVFKPAISERVKNSGIRNFFIELGLIELNRSSGTYFIKEQHFHSFGNHLNSKKLSQMELDLILKNTDELGKVAELKVLEYEKKRLSSQPDLVEKIEHTALNDVTAGYDILSWEIKYENEKAIPRYIEVKAVSMDDYRFYWSQNEVEKARKFAEKYHLYLLPVIGNKNFNFNELDIIQNPAEKILDNSGNWETRVETYQISKNIK